MIALRMALAVLPFIGFLHAAGARAQCEPKEYAQYKDEALTETGRRSLAFRACSLRAAGDLALQARDASRAEQCHREMEKALDALNASADAGNATAFFLAKCTGDYDTALLRSAIAELPDGPARQSLEKELAKRSAKRESPTTASEPATSGNRASNPVATATYSGGPPPAATSQQLSEEATAEFVDSQMRNTVASPLRYSVLEAHGAYWCAEFTVSNTTKKIDVRRWAYDIAANRPLGSAAAWNDYCLSAPATSKNFAFVRNAAGDRR